MYTESLAVVNALADIMDDLVDNDGIEFKMLMNELKQNQKLKKDRETQEALEVTIE